MERGRYLAKRGGRGGNKERKGEENVDRELGERRG